MGQFQSFSLHNVRFEAPRDLRSRKIQVRFRRAPKGTTANASQSIGRVIVYYKGERMGEAKPVDLRANDRKPRTKKNGALS